MNYIEIAKCLIFENDKENARHVNLEKNLPDFTGKVVIKGTEYGIGGWISEWLNGRKSFIYLKFTTKNGSYSTSAGTVKLYTSTYKNNPRYPVNTTP